MIVEKLNNLMEQFLERQISAEEFERSYIDYHQGDSNNSTGGASDIYFWLFTEVDAFCIYPELFDPTQNITEDQLRESVRIALNRLSNLST